MVTDPTVTDSRVTDPKVTDLPEERPHDESDDNGGHEAGEGVVPVAPVEAVHAGKGEGRRAKGGRGSWLNEEYCQLRLAAAFPLQNKRLLHCSRRKRDR